MVTEQFDIAQAMALVKEATGPEVTAAYGGSSWHYTVAITTEASTGLTATIG